MSIVHYGKTAFSVFQEITTSTDKPFYFERRLEHQAVILRSFEILLAFCNFLRFKVLTRLLSREATRIYQFITNNHVSFLLWWIENLLNHQKVKKYYGHHCLQIFPLLFISLLIDFITKNSNISSSIYFIFVPKRHTPNLKGF